MGEMKKVEIEFPAYDRSIRLSWEKGFEISFRIHPSGKSAELGANRSGLISLARLLLTLAEPETPAGSHVHLDEMNSLEDDSDEIIISKWK